MSYSNKFPIDKQCGHGWLLILVMSAFFIVSPYTAQLLQAQESQKPQEPGPAVRLTPDQWKALEGYFQNSRNSEMYVQFSAKDTVLLAKLLWDNSEIRLIPESALSFYNKQEGEEGPLRIRFSKDSTGNISRVLVGNNDVWIRTKDYKPVVKIEMQHTPDQLKRFEGLYQFQRDKERFIQFTVRENNLVLKQHWDGEEVRFVPQSELDFFSKELPSFSLSFAKDEKGNINQAIAFKSDIWKRIVKSHPDNEQLRAIEGKYQFKDDPDNYIQITAKQNMLIVKQLWDGKEIVLEPQTDTYFYNTDLAYPLLVVKDKDGKAARVQVLGMDWFDKVKD
ncbi:MAG TPA: hypothetical protein VK543_04645 [Puia sp.]|nr:hypothetical protein [Puia sp.]